MPHPNPSSIYSCSIGHILEDEICHLGRLGRNKKFLKRRNFCLSMLLFEVVFSTFYMQKNFFFKLLKHFSNRMKKLHNNSFITNLENFFFLPQKLKKQATTHDFLVGNRECNTERGFKNQLYIELGWQSTKVLV